MALAVFFEPRLSALTVRAPRVIVRRNRRERATVAGIDLDLSAQTEGDSGLIEWLLKRSGWCKSLAARSSGRMSGASCRHCVFAMNIRLQNDGRRHSVGDDRSPADRARCAARPAL